MPSTDSLAKEQGNDYIRQNFPQCDFVDLARLHCADVFWIPGFPIRPAMLIKDPKARSFQGVETGW